MKKVYIFNTHTHTYKQTNHFQFCAQWFCVSVLIARVLTVDNVHFPFDHKMDNTKLQDVSVLLAVICSIYR